MPYVSIAMFAGRSLEQKRAVVRAVTDALVQTLNVSAADVHVILQEMDKDQNAEGGVLECDRG